MLLANELVHLITLRLAYLKDLWNILDWIGFLGTLYFSSVLIGRDYTWNGIERQIFGVIVLYLWIKLLEYSAVFKPTSSASKLFIAMTVVLLQYFVVILVFVLALGHR